MTRMQARMLPDGRRLHLQDGPIDLIIGAEGDSVRAHEAAKARFAEALAACLVRQEDLLPLVLAEERRLERRVPTRFSAQA